VKPTRSSFYQRVGARSASNDGVLGGDLTDGIRYVERTINLDDPTNVVAREGAVVACGGAWSDRQNLLETREGVLKLGHSRYLQIWTWQHLVY
jgi:hypothetical protein